MDVIGQVAVGIHEGELQFPPRLADVLEIIPQDGVVLVELKEADDTTIHLIEELVRHYKTTHAKPATIKFISFSAEGIAKMKKLMPSHQCYLLCVGIPMISRGQLDRQARHAAALGLDGIDVNADTQLVDREFVRRCGHLGLKVMVWRCRCQYENPVLWNAMRLAGVEAFTTDFPSDIMTWARRENTNIS